MRKRLLVNLIREKIAFMLAMFKKKSAPLLIFLLAASCVLIPLPTEAHSRTLIVPDDYPTIADAIANATEGETVYVKEGIYREHTLNINKTIKLLGEDKANTTIVGIDEPGAWDFGLPFPPPKPNVIDIIANNVIVSGFIIKSSSNGFGSMTNGLHVEGNYTLIYGNIVTDLGDVQAAIGIDVSGVGNQIVGNIMVGLWSGVSFSGSYCIVAQNTIEHGLFEGSGDHNLIINNSVSKDFTGGMDLTVDFSVIANNTVTEQNEGISVYGTENTVAFNNASNNGLWGIDIRSPMQSSGNNRVYGNTAAHNRDGINLLEGRNNTFYANNLIDNEIGMSIVWAKGWMDHKAYDNIFFHNNFVDNSHGAADWSSTGINQWDNGAEGNYWSDYTGTDGNGDGIGDTSYEINTPFTFVNGEYIDELDPSVVNPNEVLDHYPLMAAYNIEGLAVELPDWANMQISVMQTSEPQPEFQTQEPQSTEASMLVPIAVGAGVLVFAVTACLLYWLKAKKNLKVKSTIE